MTSTEPGNRARPAVDETLLRYLSRLTVAERLALNDAAVRIALDLRAAFAGMPATAGADAHPTDSKVGSKVDAEAEAMVHAKVGR